MKISVITPTVRPGGLEILRKCLSTQSLKDFQWLIGSPFRPSVMDDGKLPIRWVKDDFTDGYWSLNRIYNKLFKEAEGELIVSWQDFIWIGPTGLQQFWDAYEKTKGIITGVGDQYAELDEHGKPFIKVWSDPRKREDLGSFYEVNWVDCEWNWAAIPKKLIEEAGGMDEDLDFLGYGGDQFQLCERLNELGAHFWIDQANESLTLRHKRDHDDWDQHHVLFNGAYQKEKEKLVKEGKWPHLDYLSK